MSGIGTKIFRRTQYTVWWGRRRRLLQKHAIHFHTVYIHSEYSRVTKTIISARFPFKTNNIQFMDSSR